MAPCAISIAVSTAVAVAIAMASTLVAGCGGAGRAAASPASPLVSKATAPEGVTLSSACTPTGPELCFNAIDDNCNGIFDEGCGLATGVLQFTIAWGDSPADVDIAVTDPGRAPGDTATRVDAQHPMAPSGLRLDRDCPDTHGQHVCNGQNVENIYLDGTEPPRGTYAVEVRVDKLNNAPTPVHVQFGARLGGTTYGAELLFTQADEKRVFSFEL